MATTFTKRWILLGTSLLALTLLIIGAGGSRAWAADAVAAYRVAGSIATDGSLAVKASITFEGAAPASLVQRFRTDVDAFGDRQYVHELTDVTAAAAGRQLNPTLAKDGPFTVVTIPTEGVTGPVDLSYVVKGAAMKEPTGQTTVSWRLLQGLDLPVREFTAEIAVPSMLELVDCAAGPPITPGACTFYGGGTHDNPNPFFSDGPRGAGEIVLVTVRFPAGAVAANENVRLLWTLGRAFSTGPAEVISALVLLALSGLGYWLLHRRIGRDSAHVGEPHRVAEFHPVAAGEVEFRVLDQIRPGQIGTLVDERVDPVDVTATLLDLAIRGHLLITELPRSNEHALPDWTFARRESADRLADFERTLLDATAPAHGEPVKASNLVGAIGSVIGQVQSELYDDVVTRGWFSRRPDQIRNTWSRLGWYGLAVAVVATGLLAAFSTFGMLGLALIVTALLAIIIGQEMPARTGKGSAVLGGLALLRAQLLGQPTGQMPKGRELHELSEILPYAVVLGGVQRWLDALVAADGDDEPDSTDLSWYHAPEGWHLRDLPASLETFVTTIQGRLFTR